MKLFPFRKVRPRRVKRRRGRTAKTCPSIRLLKKFSPRIVAL
jgi:hypothetical protein